MKFLNYLFIAAIASFIAVGCGVEGDKAEVSEKKSAAGKLETALTYHVETATSKVLWEGSKNTGQKHNGTIDIQVGEFHLDGDKITSGNFIIDMTTIEDLDLEGDYKARLEAHLKGTAEGKEDDFFNTTKFPTAEFEITEVKELTGDDENNSLVYGNLTMKDITHNVGFKANIQVDGNTITATAPQFKIDRTKWDVMFMAKSIMDDLKNGFVNDDIGIALQITATKK